MAGETWIQAAHLTAVRAAITAAPTSPPVSPPAPTPQVEYLHLDALGSLRAVTDHNGQILRRHDFLPFGEEWQPPTVAPDTRRFTGHERDAETGMDYFGARYYRADIGRFTTIDPVTTTAENLVDPQRWNRYAYAKNNPLRYTDPTGKYIVGCDSSNSECAAAMRRFEALRQQALGSPDSTVRAVVLGLGDPGASGPTVTPDLEGLLGKNENASYDPATDTLLFRALIAGREGMRTIVHEGSHRLDAVIAKAKPEFEDVQITRWESEIRAFDAGARIAPDIVLGGIVLRPGDRQAIEQYMQQIPGYRNTGKYPLVERRIW